MRDKLGLFGEDKGDIKLINNLLNWMVKNKADYTNTFCYLMNEISEEKIYKGKEFLKWLEIWKNRSLLNNSSKEKNLQLMKKNNPIVIPRNHKVDEALRAANINDLNVLKKLLNYLKKPYDKQSGIKDYMSPMPLEVKYQTFCGT